MHALVVRGRQREDRETATAMDKTQAKRVSSACIWSTTLSRWEGCHCICRSSMASVNHLLILRPGLCVTGSQAAADLSAGRLASQLANSNQSRCCFFFPCLLAFFRPNLPHCSLPVHAAAQNMGCPESPAPTAASAVQYVQC